MQQHFRLQLVRPTGLWTMFHHRCGLVMVAAVGWMVFEVGNSLLVTRLFYQRCVLTSVLLRGAAVYQGILPLHVVFRPVKKTAFLR